MAGPFICFFDWLLNKVFPPTVELCFEGKDFVHWYDEDNNQSGIIMDIFIINRGQKTTTIRKVDIIHMVPDHLKDKRFIRTKTLELPYNKGVQYRDTFFFQGDHLSYDEIEIDLEFTHTKGYEIVHAVSKFTDKLKKIRDEDERRGRLIYEDLPARARNTYKFDAFICHASEDKNDFIKSLANELTRKGVKIWYDEFSLKLGDSLREKIDEGLRDSRYGIVILSKAFFLKNWPKLELDGLISKEIDGEKVILPIWHGVSRDDVARYSPILSGRVASISSEGLSAVVNDILEVIFE